MNPRLRDVLLFSSGMAILFYEAVLSDNPSPSLVGASMTMMVGAPAVYRVLSQFENKSKGDDNK